MSYNSIGAGSEAVMPHTHNFVIGDWVGPDAGWYSISITEAVHAKGQVVDVNVYDENDNEVEVSVNSADNGDVIISVPASPDLRFGGKVHINS